MADEQRWHDLAEQVVTRAGFDLEDFVVQTAGRRTMVQVVIDGDDGLPMDAAAEISRALSAAFDEAEEQGADAFGGLPYTLEVTSPGIGRPLTLPRHFTRARGRLVAVTTHAGTRTVRILGTAQGDTVLQVLTGKHGTDIEDIPLEAVSRARVEVDFSGPSAAVREILLADPRTAGRFAAPEAITDLDGADSDDADFDGADFGGADFDDVDSDEVDSDDADFGGADSDDADSGAADPDDTELDASADHGADHDRDQEGK